jgi:guanylate kinase
MKAGRVFVVSAPSGAGKSTLLEIVGKKFPGLYITVSATTRTPRPGEMDGIDYYFVSSKQFEDGIKQGVFAEWAEVHGNLYGTYKTEIDDKIREGTATLLELDVQGMRTIKALYPEMCSIFITPPSMEELEHRLKVRGVNEAADMCLRLANAAVEMAAIKEFDYIVVNDDVARASAELSAVLNKNGAV